jgi:hypothetical protein
VCGHARGNKLLFQQSSDGAAGGGCISTLAVYFSADLLSAVAAHPATVA